MEKVHGKVCVKDSVPLWGRQSVLVDLGHGRRTAMEIPVVRRHARLQILGLGALLVDKHVAVWHTRTHICSSSSHVSEGRGPHGPVSADW